MIAVLGGVCSTTSLAGRGATAVFRHMVQSLALLASWRRFDIVSLFMPGEAEVDLGRAFCIRAKRDHHSICWSNSFAWFAIALV